MNECFAAGLRRITLAWSSLRKMLGRWISRLLAGRPMSSEFVVSYSGKTFSVKILDADVARFQRDVAAALAQNDLLADEDNTARVISANLESFITQAVQHNTLYMEPPVQGLLGVLVSTSIRRGALLAHLAKKGPNASGIISACLRACHYSSSAEMETVLGVGRDITTTPDLKAMAMAIVESLTDSTLDRLKKEQSTNPWTEALVWAKRSKQTPLSSRLPGGTHTGRPDSGREGRHKGDVWGP